MVSQQEAHNIDVRACMSMRSLCVLPYTFVTCAEILTVSSKPAHAMFGSIVT